MQGSICNDWTTDLTADKYSTKNIENWQEKRVKNIKDRILHAHQHAPSNHDTSCCPNVVPIIRVNPLQYHPVV